MALDAEMQRLVNNALVRLPGATVASLQLELFNAADEFFKETNVWKEDIDVRVPGGDPAGTIYVLASNEPATIVRLMWCFGKGDAANVRGREISAAMEVPGELTLAFQPASAETYTATIALTVQDPVNRDGYVVFPAWVLQRYHQVLLDGLLAKMMTQPNKPWTNNQMSVYYLRKFAGGKAQARVEATRNNVYRAQAWRFPSIAHGSQRK